MFALICILTNSRGQFHMFHHEQYKVLAFDNVYALLVCKPDKCTCQKGPFFRLERNEILNEICLAQVYLTTKETCYLFFLVSSNS